MFIKAKERIESFGYEFKNSDKVILDFAIQKVENTIKNECNVNEIPEGLFNIAVDMAAGEFLLSKKTFAPEDLSEFDLSYAVKQIQTGDTNTVFAVGDGSLTDEQRLDAFINHLLTYGRKEFLCYRKLRW